MSFLQSNEDECVGERIAVEERRFILSGQPIIQGYSAGKSAEALKLARIDVEDH